MENTYATFRKSSLLLSNSHVLHCPDEECRSACTLVGDVGERLGQIPRLKPRRAFDGHSFQPLAQRFGEGSEGHAMTSPETCLLDCAPARFRVQGNGKEFRWIVRFSDERFPKEGTFVQETPRIRGHGPHRLRCGSATRVVNCRLRLERRRACRFEESHEFTPAFGTRFSFDQFVPNLSALPHMTPRSCVPVPVDGAPRAAPIQAGHSFGLDGADYRNRLGANPVPVSEFATKRGRGQRHWGRALTWTRPADPNWPPRVARPA